MSRTVFPCTLLSETSTSIKISGRPQQASVLLTPLTCRTLLIHLAGATGTHVDELGEGRTQGTLFPVTLEELIPEDHVCRVIDAFVNRLDMAGLGFERAEAAETGRPGYDPRDLLKLFLYGYLQRIRSSRRLENECRRNIELMWLLGRLVPDHKTVAEFRRMHSEALTQTGAELIRFGRSVGLVRGEWIAIDGSKFRAASSVGSVRERDALQRYLEEMESADAEEEVVMSQAPWRRR